jgi:hypothetical protein
MAKSLIEGGVYSHFGGVEQDRIGCAGHGGVRAARIARVALEEIGQGFRLRPRLAPRRGLQPAATGTHLRRGVHIEFGRRLGGDDRAYITAVQHGAAGLCGEIPLQVEQRRPHRRQGGDAAGGFTPGG